MSIFIPIQTKECELPFEISSVQQSFLNPDDDELIVCSKEGKWYFVKFSDKKFSCYPLTSLMDIEGKWVLDQAAGLN
jgi:hypothetical protein